MNPEQWRQIELIYNRSLELEPDKRAAYLEGACGDNDSLRKEVESLLSRQADAEHFIELPAIEIAARMLATNQSPNNDTDSASCSLLRAGHMLMHYRIEEKIGGGGMGIVYKAHDGHLGRSVALKVLPPGAMADLERRRRFIQEAKAASALNHPNIITIYDISQAEGIDFIAMEYVPGKTLAQLIDGKGLPLKETLNCAIQIADALAAAHESGIVHRDLKPGNIMVTDKGQVKVLDFGLAKLAHLSHGDVLGLAKSSETLTKNGAVVGTVAYMSPEQAEGKTVDARSDIFSFGAVLYEMVTGRQAFKGDCNISTLAAVLHDEPEPIGDITRGLPQELEHIIGKALEKDREVRYQVASEICADLRRLKRVSDSSLSVAAGLAAPLVPTKKKPWLLIAGAAIGAAALTATGTWYLRKAPILTKEDKILITDFVNTTGNEVFDGALKTALRVKLEESPYLNVIPERAAEETLKYMERPPGTRITPAVGREVCQRLDSKALIIGEIAQVASSYLITLNAENCQTGESLAQEQARAESQEKVLDGLDRTATGMRKRLGESLASVERANTPLDQATTHSLQALKAHSIAVEMNGLGRRKEAIAFSRRAVDLDPNFASGHYFLSINLWNDHQYDLSRESAKRAYELKERATERERLQIEENYHSDVTYDFEKAVEVALIGMRTHPKSAMFANVLSNDYIFLGQWEDALGPAREAVRLAPTGLPVRSVLAQIYIALGKYVEARATLEEAIKLGLESSGLYLGLYRIARLEGDRRAMERHVGWLKEQARNEDLLRIALTAEILAGQFQRARVSSDALVVSLLNQGMSEEAALELVRMAYDLARGGNLDAAEKLLERALALSQTCFTRWSAALASASARDFRRAKQLVDRLVADLPEATTLNRMIVPTIQALEFTDQANPRLALERLRSAEKYELVSSIRLGTLLGLPVIPILSVQGEALLAQNQGEEATAAFQKILDHPGLFSEQVEYPLAHLGLARAKVSMGDQGAGRKHYQDFFALWKDADPDIPILQKAKAEYAKLR